MTSPQSDAFRNYNSRVFYACQAVLVNRKDDSAASTFGRNIQDEDLAYEPTSGFFLRGVQSVGVSYSVPSESPSDVGRFQKRFLYFQKPQFEITIERIIPSEKESVKNEYDFFYQVDSSNYVASADGYRQTHILYEDNLGTSGSLNDSQKTMKNYDITLLYTPDRFARMYNAVGRDTDTSPGSPGIQEDPDAKKVQAITYRGCLITNISYNMSVGGRITEAITLITRMATRDSEKSAAFRNLDNYPNLPEEWLREALVPPVPETDPPTKIRGPESGKVLTWNDLNLLGHQDDSATIATDASPTTTDCLLPPEVLTMFDLLNDQDPAKRHVERKRAILGIQSVSININIDYSELDDIGLWRGASQDDFYTDAGGNQKELGYMNQYRYVNLPVQVTTSFTGISRQQYPSMALFQDDSTRGFPVSDITFSRVSGVRTPDTNEKPTYWRQWPQVGPMGSSTGGKIRLVAKKHVVEAINNFYVWDLGERNYLVDIGTAGGSTGGDSVEVTMSYQNDCSDIVIVKDIDGVKNLPYPAVPR